ncbi:MAG: hypothetical protein WD847_20380 [Pirellulales bacterium]
MVLSAETLAAGQADVARLVLAGYRDNRERLRSGIYRATGKRSYNSKRHGFDTTVDMSLFCAFDFDRQLFRFDRTEPHFNPKTAGDSMGGKFVRTVDRVIQRHDGGDTVTIQPAGARPLHGILPFDIRGIGSLNLPEVERGTQVERAFASPAGFLAEEKIEAAVAESDRIYRLSWLLANGQARRTIWFDAAAGYSPIRLEDRYVPGEAMAIVEVAWSNESGVWVPSTARLETRTGSLETQDIRSYSIAFYWKQVNGPVPDRLFAVEGMEDDTDELFVVDTRLGQPILIKKPESAPLTSRPVRDGRTAGWAIVIGASILACCALLSYYVFRRRIRGVRGT